MPIYRTASGLILFDALDSSGDWAGCYYDGQYSYHQFYSGPVGVYGATGSASIAPTTVAEWEKTINLGTGTGRRLHIWKKASHGQESVDWAYVMTASAFIIRGSVLSEGNPNPTALWSSNSDINPSYDWTRISGSIPDNLTGNQLCAVAYGYVSGCNDGQLGSPPNPSITSYAKRLVVCASDLVTVGGLDVGQKVELYNAATDILIGSGTVTSGTSTTIDVSTADFPELMYAKIYFTDGVKLIEKTLPWSMCGGDSWVFTASKTILAVESDRLVFLKS